MSTIIDQLSWRAAVKQYDPTQKVTDEELQTILEAGRLAPSWYGLQPWKFIVVSDDQTKEKLSAAAWHQPQIKSNSHLLVFARRTDIGENLAEELIEATASTTGVPTESLDGFKDSLMAFISGMDQEAHTHWATSQVYIPLGTMVAAASSIGVDNSPMGGFDREQFDEILGLKEHNAASVVIMAIGHRSEADEYSKRPKVRFDLDTVVIHHPKSA